MLSSPTAKHWQQPQSNFYLVTESCGWELGLTNYHLLHCSIFQLAPIREWWLHSLFPLSGIMVCWHFPLCLTHVSIISTTDYDPAKVVPYILGASYLWIFPILQAPWALVKTYGYAHFIRQTQTQSHILGKRTAASSENDAVLFQSCYLRTPLHPLFWACCSRLGPEDFSVPSGLWLQRCGEQLAVWGHHQWTPADPLSAERRTGVVAGHSGTCKCNEMQRRSWCLLQMLWP